MTVSLSVIQRFMDWSGKSVLWKCTSLFLINLTHNHTWTLLCWKNCSVLESYFLFQAHHWSKSWKQIGRQGCWNNFINQAFACISLVSVSHLTAVGWWVSFLLLLNLIIQDIISNKDVPNCRFSKSSWLNLDIRASISLISLLNVFSLI